MKLQHRFDEARALMHRAAADMAQHDLVGRRRLRARRLERAEAVLACPHLPDPGAPVEIGEARRHGQRGGRRIEQAFQPLETLQGLRARDACGQLRLERRVHRDEPVVLIDEELVIGDPPGVVQRDDIGYAGPQRLLDDARGQTLDAVEMHEIRPGDLEDALEGRQHVVVEGAPVHVHLDRRADAIDWAAAVDVDAERADLHPLEGRQDRDLEVVAVARQQLLDIVLHDAGRAAVALRCEEDMADQDARLVGLRRRIDAGRRPIGQRDLELGRHGGRAVLAHRQVASGRSDPAAKLGVLDQRGEMAPPVVGVVREQDGLAVAQRVLVGRGRRDDRGDREHRRLEPLDLALAVGDRPGAQHRDADVAAGQDRPIGVEIRDEGKARDPGLVGIEALAQRNVAGDDEADPRMIVQHLGQGRRDELGKVTAVCLGAAAVEDRHAVARRSLASHEARGPLAAVVEPVRHHEGPRGAAFHQGRDRLGERPRRDDGAVAERDGLPVERDAVAEAEEVLPVDLVLVALEAVGEVSREDEVVDVEESLDAERLGSEDRLDDLGVAGHAVEDRRGGAGQRR